MCVVKILSILRFNAALDGELVNSDNVNKFHFGVVCVILCIMLEFKVEGGSSRKRQKQSGRRLVALLEHNEKSSTLL